MKCPNCGMEITNSGDAFCSNCGTALEMADNALSGAAAEPVSHDPGVTTPVTQYAPAPSVPTQPTQPAQPTRPTQHDANAVYQPAQTDKMPAPAGSAFTPAPLEPPAPAPAKKGGVSPIVVGLLIAVIVILIVLVVLLIVKPFDNGQKNSSSSSAQTTITVNSRASSSATDNSSVSSSSSADSEDSAAASTDAEPEDTGATTNAPTTDPGATQSQPLTQSPEPSPYEAPFYGVWIGAFSIYDNAVSYKADANSKGLQAEIYETTDWENLNPTHYWVVSCGRAASQGEAQAICDRAHAAGFTDAYVKHTGNHR